jgi:uncharacterized protein YjbI with pentapeptide repeats
MMHWSKILGFIAVVTMHGQWRRKEEGGVRADFSGQDLTAYDLSHLNLAGSLMRGTVLRGCRVEGADCREVDATGADLRGLAGNCDWERATLDNALTD